jgi:hypothetical protein
MDWNLFWIFVVLNVVNVVIQTVKSIATIKCGRVSAAVINAVAYGLYTIVVVYTICELPLWLKAAVVAVANLIGVYIVKLLEEKKRKDKLWKVEATIPHTHTDQLHYDLKIRGIPHNFIEDVGQYTVFNIYCETQKESAIAKVVLNQYHAKYFVSESKTL